MEAHAPDLHLIDTHYLRPGHAGAWLLEHQGRAAFIECNTTLAVPRLMAALEARGLAPDAVDWVFVTHVHLDHAGGAGALLQQLPSARLVVHPSGARHMTDPSKLVAGATAVYGEARMAELYGEILPVAAERVLAPQDGQVIELAGRPLTALHTPGHAWHHLAVHDAESSGVFTGDVFGLAYRALATPEGPFLFPTTAPSQFSPEAMLASIERIEALEPRRIYLTHFGALAWEPRLPTDLRKFVENWTGLARTVVADHPPGPERQAAMERQLRFTLRSHFQNLGGQADQATFDGWMELDIEINAQGLVYWAQKQA